MGTLQQLRCHPAGGSRCCANASKGRQRNAQPVEGKRLLEKRAKSAIFCQERMRACKAAWPGSAVRVPGGTGNPGCCPFKMWGEKDTNEEPDEN